jgi:hypothetical protein
VIGAEPWFVLFGRTGHLTAVSFTLFWCFWAGKDLFGEEDDWLYDPALLQTG